MKHGNKVLIGDDTSEYGVLFRKVLQNKGFEVVLTPKQGKAILSAIEKEKPAVVVMDTFIA